MIRNLLPATVGILIMLGVLRWVGQQMGLFGMTAGVLLLTVAAMGVVGGLLWYFAYRLDRSDTVRSDAEESLRRTSRYFELSHDMVCTADFDGFFTQLNPAWTAALGWSEAELCARPFLEFVHPDDREKTLRETTSLAEGGGGSVDFVNRYATKDGGWRWIDWRAMTVAGEGLIYASARDVTSRVAAVAALETSERQTRQILDSAHDAFIAIDARGLITDWNPQAEASFGWAREDVLGRELATTIIPEGQRKAHRRGMNHFLATGQARVLGKRLELVALHRDGREFPIEMTISALQTENGVSFNAFLRDISDRQRAQTELAAARDQALEASRMKSMFVANVSHEIRTPMNGVIGMSELLLDTELDERQREYAQTISSSGDTLLKVIDDILDFSKIEAGKLELNPADFNMRDAIERACGMLAARAHEKGLELVVAIEPEVPALVHGDAERLRQVIANFVSNAITFTAEGEVVVRASAGPTSSGAKLVRLEVSDTGIGIEPEALGQLFKPFSQADGSTSRKYGGTGLGLAISKQLIELMGGEVGADSQPDTGSCFWFALSLACVDDSAGAPEEERELAGLRVLLVDDNATNRTILQRQLNSWQMGCETAANAGEAMALLDSARSAGMPFALALLDVNMPDVDGYELARAIRARPDLRDMRLVLLTSSGHRADAPDEAALDGWLTKPVRQSRLYEEIQAVIAGERPMARRVEERAVGATGASGREAMAAVLVVEDTLVNQRVATRMLEKWGFEAHIAGNGRRALEALCERSFVAVLMDCQIPELDGYETTREIRRREQGGRRIPIIAMTANAMQGERERCLAAGMDDYLSKPLRNRALKEVLTRWVPNAAAGSTGTDGALPASEARAADASGWELLDLAVVGELECLEQEALTNLLALYFAEAAADISELSDAIDRGETLAVAQTAHKFKGAALTVGATQVSAIAAELQALAATGDLTTADDLVNRLRSGLDDTREAFRARVPKTDKDVEPRRVSSL